MKKTKVINIIAGPGVGKSVLASQIFTYMKVKGYNIEFIGEYAKELVYHKEFELLNNQHYVSFKQREMLKLFDGKVDYIVTDGSILHGLAYNILHKKNVSNIKRTKKKILEYYYEFENITIFLERNIEYRYEQDGRIQDLDGAIEVDILLKKLLKKYRVKCKNFSNTQENFDKILKYIIKN